MGETLHATWRMEDVFAERIASLEHFGTRCEFQRGKELYGQDEPSIGFFYIKSGLVKISIIRQDGMEIVLENMGPKTICGEACAFTGTPNFSSATAQEPTVAIRFGAQQIDAAVRADSQFAMVMLKLTSLKQRVLAERLENMASNKPEVRILDLFKRLSELFPRQSSRGLIIETRLTHELIAAMTGLTRVTVTRTIGNLRQRGIVDLDGEYFVILENARSRPVDNVIF